MRFTLLKPCRADIAAQLLLVKPAFNGIYDPKREFDFCSDAVMRKRASFYHLKGRGVSLRFVGIVTEDNDYLILAMTGRGLVKAAPVIIDAVRSQSYRAIRYHTARPGMTRILKQFGFSVINADERDSVLSLALGGE